MSVKDYLSQAERTNAILLKALTVHAHEVVEEVARYADPEQKEMVKSLRSGVTWMTKGLEAMMEPVTQKNKLKVELEAARHGVGLIPVKDIAKHTQYMIDIDKAQREAAHKNNPDALLDMAEMTMQTVCRMCDGSPKSVCKIYEALTQNLIEPWQEDHPRCHYAQAGVVEDAAKVG